MVETREGGEHRPERVNIQRTLTALQREVHRQGTELDRIATALSALQLSEEGLRKRCNKLINVVALLVASVIGIFIGMCLGFT